jgi:hypothetical protein
MLVEVPPSMTDLQNLQPTSLETRTINQPDTSLQKLHGHRLKTLVNIHALAPLLGGHSVSDPPDPISNSAVKPDSANGTNAQALEE